ncbi:MAG: hypothetical protein K6E75_09645 [Lachnospiraceae bacterium]|nr:hypothetical protein [Lachnospiraceae bacterium]
MNNLILFVNQFLSYILVMAIIVIIGGIGFVIGVKWRKAKDAKAASDMPQEVSGDEKTQIS